MEKTKLLSLTTVFGALAMTGCAPWSQSEPTTSMVVEVEVTSDAAMAGTLHVEVDAREDPQRVREQDTPLPYAATFEVPLDVPFPLSGSTVEATASEQASWIACRIVQDGAVVAEDRAEGAGAIAVCEKKLRAGPQ
ncbi:hypothetical protein [Rhodococcus sp. 14-2483-1-2]|uniref:hypothetical protein n=1 Tax=Rhodococcus sp. 14-2483-1-2 TaxID=2023147 RepID=UPI000B9C0D3F|nr:hypothetical protein [Rhodococcus sp. 14-2483-1-2]OZF26164.1 hypothetical protein CH295_26460 [Rhodococcus sp. 14-2483-1-2]